MREKVASSITWPNGPTMSYASKGGDNAGHTVVNDYGKTVLHIIPCGIFYPNVHNIIGTGCVVNPQSLLEEIAHLKSIGVSCDRLWISSRAQMVMPYHRKLDELEEKARGVRHHRHDDARRRPGLQRQGHPLRPAHR